MITNTLSILCQNIIIDKETNATSYINSIEDLTANKLPGRIPKISLGTLWTKDSKESEILEIRIKLSGPDGSEKTILETGKFEMKARNHRINVLMDGLPFDKEGFYRFIIEYRENDAWKQAKTLFLSISLRKTDEIANPKLAVKRGEELKK